MEHHAFYYEGPLALFPALAADARTQFGARGAGDPSVQSQVWQKFGIDEARALAQAASLKAVGGHTLFILGIGSITTEAQQALLKLFEEPQPGTIFVILVPHGVLLPTVLSRFMRYPKNLGEGPEAGLMAGEAKEFLSSPYTARSEWIKKFLKKDDEDDSQRELARNFLDALEARLYARFSKESKPGEKEPAHVRDMREGLQDIGHFRQYLADRSPSLKMILEHFAATLPKIE